MVLYAQGRFEEAEKAFRVLVLEGERKHGAEHPDTLAQRNNLANCLTASGRAAEGEKEHRRLLLIRERLFGVEHVDTLSSRNNLAIALQAQGKDAEAEKEYRTVLKFRERILPPEDRDVLKTCYALALCLESQSRHQEAEVFAERSESGWLKTLGVGHPVFLRAKALRQRIKEAQTLLERDSSTAAGAGQRPAPPAAGFSQTTPSQAARGP
jgi:tetratricopeptide (TPR) repeat protein